MQIDFFSGNIPFSAALYDHVEYRATSVLSRFADRIGRVVVRLLDVNGHRHGVDKLVRIEATLHGTPVVLAQAIDRDAYQAVDRAITSLRSSIARRVDRIRGR